jgi:hypothetical protein
MTDSNDNADNDNAVATDWRMEPPYTRARRTCAALLAHNDSDSNNQLPVRLDRPAATALREALDLPAVLALGTSLASDPNFTSMSGCDFRGDVDTEAAWIVLTHALDFGSGWRRDLHAHRQGRGAWVTIKAGVEALFGRAVRMQGRNLSVAWLTTQTVEDVATAFGLTQTCPSLEEGLAGLLQSVLQDLGRGCTEAGVDSLQVWTVQRLAAVAASPTPAGDFVGALVDAFPTTFDDRHVVSLPGALPQDKLEVCFYKKAQLVTGELYHRFGASADAEDYDARFAFADGPALTAYIDNVICAALRYKQVIVPNAVLRQQIESDVFLPSGSLEEVALRAAALVAVDVIVQDTNLSSAELGNYLWAGLGKLPEVRKFARHATQTIFY